jgi:hypothetical protein
MSTVYRTALWMRSSRVVKASDCQCQSIGRVKGGPWAAQVSEKIRLAYNSKKEEKPHIF